ncbi:flagellar motor protein [Vibrio alfacsensis]|uniref:flagellar motor protein n=1 Tax=Vibrio alfacsensis TaxID=1074311 RepID=UPI001BED827C|nr:flagellar motor protein [Vibrio alfacsensis]BCN25886.1 chemotaxis protein MotA [Vibrio alfacsensis]
MINLPAFLIVVGGTLGCVIVQFPLKTLKNVLLYFKWLINPPIYDYYNTSTQLIQLADISRRDGILALEMALDNIDDPFVKESLLMVIDGLDKNAIDEILDNTISKQEVEITHVAKVYDAAGGYSPTMGIIGAVLGLIHAMGLLDKPDQLGHGIAVAFVATIYGVAFSNIFFLPIGSRYKLFAQESAEYRRMIADGIYAIANGSNLFEVKSRLNSHSHH